MYGPEIVENINLAEYPSSVASRNSEIESLVSEKVSQCLFDSQLQFTALPIGTIDGRSPYAPSTIDKVLGLGAHKNPPDTIYLGNAQLLSHSHTITYGGTVYYISIFVFIFCDSNILFLFVRKITSFPDLECSF